MPDLSKTWSVKNSSGKDLIVLDAYADVTLPAEHFYGLSLKTLLYQISGVTQTQTIIPNGKTVEILLTEVHTDKDTKAGLDYLMIIAEARTLFPVKVVTLAMAGNPGSFAQTEVTESDAKIYTATETFKRTVESFPTSELGTGYADVLQLQDQTKTDAWFKTTTDFKNVTSESVVVVSSYYKVYPFGWLDYQDSKTYNFYEIDQKTGKPVAKFELNYTGTSPMNYDKALPDFTAEYDGTKLIYHNGMFVDSADNQTPKIMLAGSFRILGELTQRSSDDKMVSCFMGVVNGNKMFGISDKEPDPKDQDAGFYDLMQFDNFRDYCDVFAYVIGLAIGLEFLIVIGYKIKTAYKNWKNDIPSDQEKIETALTEIKNKIGQDMTTVLRRINELRPPVPANAPDALGAEIPQPDEIPSVQVRVAARNKRIAIEKERITLTELLNNQSLYLEKVAALNGNAVQPVADSLDLLATRLELPYEQLLPEIGQVSNILRQNTYTLQGIQQANVRKINDQNSQGLDAARDVALDYTTRAEEMADARENAEREQREAVEANLEEAGQNER
ncbi:hypothetical protein FEM33_17240 [Dyadobacter flavalbus]|uniref:Uncharacterized protein n=1 Tax=Dyadobacter flavalbus TaxID=2579942 RepID=A0A5M8QWP4_9BACT|nr:hypothetical protein [Dyadobacter flavalbus]KAA6438432.1 hypothetical protein FEM33_17240 [Dyadobacter flavalbus]